MNPVKKIASKGRRFVGRCRTKFLRKLGFLDTDWRDNLPHELQFWDWALKDNGKNWDRVEWANATDPNMDLQADLKALIPAGEGARVRILDVGSGPLTRVGKRWPGRVIEIVPADPLAEEYKMLLSRHSITPLVPPVAAHGEKLLEVFGENSFDLAYASNSLDHSYDPLLVIRQMLATVKPGHYVYLWHVANEGLRENYVGLHQWNFNIRGSDLVIDDGRSTQSITSALKGIAEVKCEFQSAFNTRIVVATLKRLPAPAGTN
jgi:SAM-dependent methyltransferase